MPSPLSSRRPSRLTARFAGIATAIIAGAALAGPARAIDIQEVTSPGGIDALLVEDHSNPLIAMDFAFEGSGATQDPADKAGTANLMSSLLDEGAGDIESEAFQERLDELGVSLGYSADLDDFRGSFRAITDSADEAFDLLRLSVNDPRFDAEPVERIKGQIATGIRADLKDPNQLASRAFSRSVFSGHPYERPVEGTLDTLDAITIDDLNAFHEKAFARDNLVVGVVGDITAEELGERLDTVFGDLPESPDLEAIGPAEPEIGVSETVDLPIPQTVIRMALPGVPREDPDFFAAYLLNHILGGGSFTSRLYTQVREERGLAYGAYSYLASYEHAAILGIGTATRADAAEETIEVIEDQLSDLARNGPTAEELAAAKAFVKGAYAVNNLDSSPAIASTLVGIQLDDLGTDYIDTREDEIDAVTLEAVQREARELLSPEPSVVTVGPDGA